MQKQEFEALVGETVTDEQYLEIEWAYLQTSFNKQQFAEIWMKYKDVKLFQDVIKCGANAHTDALMWWQLWKDAEDEIATLKEANQKELDKAKEECLQLKNKLEALCDGLRMAQKDTAKLLKKLNFSFAFQSCITHAAKALENGEKPKLAVRIKEYLDISPEDEQIMSQIIDFVEENE